MVLILAGCKVDLTPTEHTLSQYGITITLPGTYCKIDERSSDRYFTVYTNVGTLAFGRFKDTQESLTEENVKLYIENNAHSELATYELLDNGAYYIEYAPREESGHMLVESVYFIQNGNDVWRIECIEIEEQYNKEAVISALTSIRFHEDEN